VLLDHIFLSDDYTSRQMPRFQNPQEKRLRVLCCYVAAPFARVKPAAGPNTFAPVSIRAIHMSRERRKKICRPRGIFVDLAVPPPRQLKRARNIQRLKTPGYRRPA
jgi:hypothetical protein